MYSTTNDLDVFDIQQGSETLAEIMAKKTDKVEKVPHNTATITTVVQQPGSTPSKINQNQ